MSACVRVKVLFSTRLCFLVKFVPLFCPLQAENEKEKERENESQKHRRRKWAKIQFEWQAFADKFIFFPNMGLCGALNFGIFIQIRMRMASIVSL